MKSLISILASMFILSGCDMSFGPGAFWKHGEEGNFDSSENTNGTKVLPLLK